MSLRLSALSLTSILVLFAAGCGARTAISLIDSFNESIFLLIAAMYMAQSVGTSTVVLSGSVIENTGIPLLLVCWLFLSLVSSFS